jgi:hypothetical protein
MALFPLVNTHDGMAGNVRAIRIQESFPLPASMAECQVYLSYLVGFYLIKIQFSYNGEVGCTRTLFVQDHGETGVSGLIHEVKHDGCVTFSQTLFGRMWPKVYISGRFFIYYRGLGNDYNGRPGFVKQKRQMARKRSQALHLFQSLRLSIIGQGVYTL